jgi:hypothetical protein
MQHPVSPSSPSFSRSRTSKMNLSSQEAVANAAKENETQGGVGVSLVLDKNEDDENTTLTSPEINSAVREYLKRIFNWKLKDICISDNENVKLDENTTTKEDNDRFSVYRKFIMWRSALILTTIPFAFITFILQVIKAKEELQQYKNLEMELEYYLYNDHDKNIDYPYDLLKKGGTFSLMLSSVAGFILFIGIGVSYYYRFKVRRSMKVFRWTFIVAVIIKCLPVLIQADAKMDLELFEPGPETSMETTGNLLALQAVFIARFRVQEALKHAVDLVPLIIAFPRGATSASLIVFGLLPRSVTARVLMMFFYPFATLLLVLGTSTLTQVAGNALLASSLGCFFVCDVLMYLTYPFIIQGDIEGMVASKRNKAMRGLKIISIILLVAWIMGKAIQCSDLTDQAPECYGFDQLNISTWTICLFLINFIRNFCLSKVLFCDIMVICTVLCEPDVEGVEGFELLKPIPSKKKNMDNTNEENGAISFPVPIAKSPTIGEAEGNILVNDVENPNVVLGNTKDDEEAKDNDSNDDSEDNAVDEEAESE